jgi:ribosomal protein S18 acetylase RimI-like enzyme
MSVTVRPMRPAEAEAVAGMVRGLALHIGTDVVPKLDGEKLAAAQDLIDVVVAEDEGRLVGACLGLMTFSTWRGAPGLYVVDLFVLPEARGRNVGLLLLRCSAQRFAKRGAEFIKLEVDETNTGAERFYARLGFTKKTEDRLHILEQDKLRQFISTGGHT